MTTFILLSSFLTIGPEVTETRSYHYSQTPSFVVLVYLIRVITDSDVYKGITGDWSIPTVRTILLFVRLPLDFSFLYRRLPKSSRRRTVQLPQNSFARYDNLSEP